MTRETISVPRMCFARYFRELNSIAKSMRITLNWDSWCSRYDTLYFARCDLGIIKIGYARSLEYRMYALGTGRAGALFGRYRPVLVVDECPMKAEKLTHDLFEKSRYYRREWYLETGDLKKFVAKQIKHSHLRNEYELLVKSYDTPVIFPGEAKAA